MTYGLMCINGSNELTLSSDAYTFSYIGKATRTGTVSYTGTSTSAQAGYSTYTINWAGPIMVAIGLNSTNSGGSIVNSVVRGSGTAWNISLTDYSNSTTGPGGAATFLDQRTDTNVYVWGAPTAATLAAWGLALYNSAGTVTGDLSRQPLTFQARVSIPASTTGQYGSATIPQFTKPAIIGTSNTYHRNTSAKPGTSNTYENTQYKGVWYWNGGTTIQRVDRYTNYDEDEGSVPASTTIAAANAILIEANGLT